MPRPRRRTLSHSEIENFLSEISAVEQQDGPIKSLSGKQDTVSADEVDTAVNEVEEETPKDEAQYIREFCKVSVINFHITFLSSHYDD